MPSDCKEGVFKFNGVKVVCARAGESPLAVAERTGLPLADFEVQRY